MKSFKSYILIPALVIIILGGNSMSVLAMSKTSNDIPYEWEISRQLIDSFKDGHTGLHIKADVSQIKMRRVYAYVYSAIPERINIRIDSDRQEIWLEPLKNQNYDISVVKAEETIKCIIKNDMSDLDKIVAIHDWIVLNSTFASSVSNSAKAITEDNIWAFCADGIFFRGSAVCSGYAAAFQLLCQKAGIPCFTINSVTKGHTWSAVYYDGAWRYLDLSSESRHKDDAHIESIYNYFMLNEGELNSNTFQFDESSDHGVTADEYIGFFNYMTGKDHDKSAASVHVSILNILAEQQNPYAMFELGTYYQNGSWGYPNDMAECFQWQYQAACLGHTVAQNNIGYFYKTGMGVKQDYQQAFYWFTTAAEKGNADSQLQLGTFYRKGLYIGTDMGQAKYWYQKSAEQGNLDATELLKLYF